MTVGDVYYVLFRHKWKIVILSLAGFAAAAGFYFLQPPPYQSQAELLIQYVSQAGTLPLVGSGEKVIVPDATGDSVINSEIQILTSLDVANQAVATIGAASILAKVGGGSNVTAAAALVRNSLRVEPAGKDSSVILVTFKHPDLQIVQPVLTEVINDYLQKHREIHSPEGQYDDALGREKDNWSARLNDTEKQLADLKNKNGIISLEDAKKGLADRIAQVQGAISDAQANLAGYEAAMKQLGTPPLEKPETVVTNAPPAAPADQVDAYNAICANLDTLHQKEQAYLLQGFTKSNVLVLDLEAQLARAQTAKADLEKQYPQIASSRTASPATGGQPAAAATDPQAQLAQVASLQEKLKVWNSQLGQLQTQATNLNSLGPVIAQLEQLKADQQSYVQVLTEGLQKSHVSKALDTGKAPNIKWVQSPSPPFQDWKKTRKTVAMLAFGGIFASLALAFLIELVLDRSVRRPVEIETRLKMPLFLSIPDTSRNGHARLAEAATRRQLLMKNPDQAAEGKAPVGDGGPAPSGKNGDMQVVSAERNPALHPFCEALRDRLIVYFEVHNLTHKPKLVSVTSASPGAGVSSIAAGLAASLSETGDGNVLLVDMNAEQGASQQFYRGKAGCGLDTALTAETKQEALVQENLYVVNGNANSSELPRILPKRFSALVPKLKASDYDYIIFDMPPVSQTSLTSRLSRFMDMTLLVVESEKTSREVVQQANTWLVESGATVGAVLNKTRKYVPERLHQEFLGDK